MAGILLNRNRQVPAEETPAFGGIAERFRRGGDLDRAIALCRDGLKRFPDQLSARVTLGWALLDKGQYDAARAELETVLRKAPDNLAAIRGLAELHDRTEGAIHTEDEAAWAEDGGHRDASPETTVAATANTVVDSTADVAAATAASAGGAVDVSGDASTVLETAADATVGELASPVTAVDAVPVELDDPAAVSLRAAHVPADADQEAATAPVDILSQAVVAIETATDHAVASEHSIVASVDAVGIELDSPSDAALEAAGHGAAAGDVAPFVEATAGFGLPTDSALDAETASSALDLPDVNDLALQIAEQLPEATGADGPAARDVDTLTLDADLAAFAALTAQANTPEDDDALSLNMEGLEADALETVDMLEAVGASSTAGQSDSAPQDGLEDADALELQELEAVLRALETASEDAESEPTFGGGAPAAAHTDTGPAEVTLETSDAANLPEPFEVVETRVAQHHESASASASEEVPAPFEDRRVVSTEASADDAGGVEGEIEEWQGPSASVDEADEAGLVVAVPATAGGSQTAGDVEDEGAQRGATSACSEDAPAELIALEPSGRADGDVQAQESETSTARERAQSAAAPDAYSESDEANEVELVLEASAAAESGQPSIEVAEVMAAAGVDSGDESPLATAPAAETALEESDALSVVGTGSISEVGTFGDGEGRQGVGTAEDEDVAAAESLADSAAEAGPHATTEAAVDVFVSEAVEAEAAADRAAELASPGDWTEQSVAGAAVEIDGRAEASAAPSVAESDLRQGTEALADAPVAAASPAPVAESPVDELSVMVTPGADEDAIAAATAAEASDEGQPEAAPSGLGKLWRLGRKVFARSAPIRLPLEQAVTHEAVKDDEVVEELAASARVGNSDAPVELELSAADAVEPDHVVGAAGSDADPVPADGSDAAAATDAAADDATVRPAADLDQSETPRAASAIESGAVVEVDTDPVAEFVAGPIVVEVGEPVLEEAASLVDVPLLAETTMAAEAPAPPEAAALSVDAASAADVPLAAAESPADDNRDQWTGGVAGEAPWLDTPPHAAPPSLDIAPADEVSADAEPEAAELEDLPLAAMVATEPLAPAELADTSNRRVEPLVPVAATPIVPPPVDVRPVPPVISTPAVPLPRIPVPVVDEPPVIYTYDAPVVGTAARTSFDQEMAALFGTHAASGVGSGGRRSASSRRSAVRALEGLLRKVQARQVELRSGPVA